MAPYPIIKISNLTKIYKNSSDRALDDISLSIYPNEIFGLLGPNGAGKTTAISILCTLLHPSSGDVFIDGLSLKTHGKEIKKIIGIVPQDIALYPKLTPFENLRFYGSIYGLKGQNLKNIINDYCEKFGIEKNKHKTSELSGGMRRRINLTAGILHRPKILFLDEPTVGIDVQSKKIIIDYLHEINHNGTTIIYTSHYMEEAENLCSRIGIIDNGKIIAKGEPCQLIESDKDCKNLEEVFLRLTGRALRD